MTESDNISSQDLEYESENNDENANIENNITNDVDTLNLFQSASSNQEEINQGPINRRSGQNQSNDISKLLENCVNLESSSENEDLLTKRKRALILKSKM